MSAPTAAIFNDGGTVAPINSAAKRHRPQPFRVSLNSGATRTRTGDAFLTSLNEAHERVPLLGGIAGPTPQTPLHHFYRHDRAGVLDHSRQGVRFAAAATLRE